METYKETSEQLKQGGYNTDISNNYHYINDGQLEKPSILNPKNLADRVWQKIWISTGKEPEKCLYNVVELFIFKFLSDLEILQNPHDFNTIYVQSKKNSETALKLYAQNVRKEIVEMFPKSDIDKTTIINGTIFVNEQGEPNLAQAILFKIVLEEFKEYDKEYGSFKNIDKQFKTRLYESFLQESAGISAMGQYFTPRNVVTGIIRMIHEDSLKEEMKVCDPFCGVGGFLLELLNEMPKLKNQYEPKNKKIKPKLTMIGFDKGSDEKEDERTIILAKANMLIYFSDLLSKYKDKVIMTEFSTQVFNKVFRLVKTNLGTLGLENDVLTEESYKDYFDLIISNPPYVTSGVSAIKREIKESGLESLYPSSGNGLEGLAVEWIINALKPNGRAFVVLPDGIMTRRGDKKLRDKILDTCTIDAIVSLPSRTFFATPKKTYIVALTKKDDKTPQAKLFFTYLISEIGETRDAKRFEIAENDLTKMAKTFRSFIANRDDFDVDNLRCKIQHISRLQNKHWLIDRDWTDDEKKEIGIADEITEIEEHEFFDLLSEVGNSMVNFANEFRNNSAITTNHRKTIKYKNIELGDDKYFDLLQCKLSLGEKKYRLLKLEMNNPISVPIYTAKKEPVAYISCEYCPEKLFLATPENPLLSFADDGDGTAGTNFIFHTTRFYNNTSRKVLKILDKNIEYAYVYYMLKNMKEHYGFNYGYKCNVENLANVSIEIPINGNGAFDLEEQQRIAKAYQHIDDKRSQAIDMLKHIIDTQVKITTIL